MTDTTARARELGRRIRMFRTQRNMSQSQLAKAASVSHPHVWKIENSESLPGIAVCLRLADVFDMSLDELVGIPRAPAPDVERANDI